MAQVRLILRDDVPKLGDAGDVVTVRPGYARNFLLPKGLAIVATEARVRELEHHRRAIAERVARQVRAMQDEKKKFDGQKLSFEVRVGEEGRLFGSVTALHIAEQLAERGLQVDHRRIELGRPIKQVGEYQVQVKLHREVRAEISVQVAAAVVPGAADAEDAADEAASAPAAEAAQPDAPADSGGDG